MKSGEKRQSVVRRQYDFSKGVRAKYAQRYARGTNLILLDPDLRDVFPSSESVNQALQTIAKKRRSRAKGGSLAGK